MADNMLTEQKKAKSSYKGVFKCGKKFKAQIQTNGVQNYLGLFDTEVEAARAYDAHARTYLGSRAKTNFKYDTPVRTLVQPRPVMSVDEQVKHIRNRPIRNAKRVYAGIKVRCNSHTDLRGMESPPSLEDDGRKYLNIVDATDVEMDDFPEITRDDLFIVTDGSSDDGDAIDGVPLVSKKRRRSTGNITPKEITTGQSCSNLSQLNIPVSAKNVMMVLKDESATTSKDDNYDFDALFDDFGISTDVVEQQQQLQQQQQESIDWAEELLFLTQSRSFDQTIDDQISQAVNFALNENFIAYGLTQPQQQLE